MRVALGLFVVCAIAAACGKKIEYNVTTSMELAILQEDGAIYENKTSEKFKL